MKHKHKNKMSNTLSHKHVPDKLRYTLIIFLLHLLNYTFFSQYYVNQNIENEIYLLKQTLSIPLRQITNLEQRVSALESGTYRYKCYLTKHKFYLIYTIDSL